MKLILRRKKFTTIMQEITSGLTGDLTHDVTYLQEQAQKYQRNRYSREISRECGRLIYEMLPEKLKKEFATMVDQDSQAFDAELEEVRFQLFKGENNRALKKIQRLIARCEATGMSKDDQVSEYFDFKEVFEEILYHQISQSEKEIRVAQIKYAEMYLLSGSLLFEMKRYAAAAEALEEAMQWNPTNAQIAFEHAEIFKVRGMLKEYSNATRKIFKIAFRPNDLARCYRNLGYYYVEQEDWQTAACCEAFSLQFEKAELAQSELFYIATKAKTVDIAPDVEMIRTCFEKQDIPFGPDPVVITLAYQLTKQSIAQGEKKAAEYFIDIVQGFFENEETQMMREEIDRM